MTDVDKVTLLASKIGQAAVWIEQHASILAAIGVGDWQRALLGSVDGRGVTFYVYGERDRKLRTLESVRELIGGEWKEHRSGDHLFLTQTIIPTETTGDLDFKVQFLATGFYEAPDGAEGR